MVGTLRRVILSCGRIFSVLLLSSGMANAASGGEATATISWAASLLLGAAGLVFASAWMGKNDPKAPRISVTKELLLGLAIAVAAARSRAFPATAVAALFLMIRENEAHYVTEKKLPPWLGLLGVAVAGFAWPMLPAVVKLAVFFFAVLVAANLAVHWCVRATQARDPLAFAVPITWSVAVGVSARDYLAATLGHHPVWPLADAPWALFGGAVTALYLARTHTRGEADAGRSIANADMARTIDAMGETLAASERYHQDVLAQTIAAIEQPTHLAISSLNGLADSATLGLHERKLLNQAIRMGKEALSGVSAISTALRLREGTLQLTRMAVDLRACLDDAIASVQRQNDVLVASFDVKMEDSLSYVFADVDQLRPSLTTLLAHVSENSRAGSVHIQLAQTEEYVSITIDDHRAACEAAVELLRSAKSSVTSNSASHAVDLRLWVAGRIFFLHGFAIAWESKGIPSGSRWTIKLPRIHVSELPPLSGSSVVTATLRPPQSQLYTKDSLTIPSPESTVIKSVKSAPLAGALRPAGIPVIGEVSVPASVTFRPWPEMMTIPLSSRGNNSLAPKRMPSIMPASLRAKNVVLAPPPTIKEPDPLDRRVRILVADDDPVVRNVIAAQLLDLNADVVMATDGVDALAHIQSSEPFDLILSDVLMPRLTGVQLCIMMRAMYTAAELPFVLMSSRSDQDDVARAFEAGASDYLVKPTVKRELLKRISTHLQVSKEALAHQRFVPREFLKLLGRERVADVRLGDHVSMDLTILFADIRGFTTMSEALGPAETFRFLNNCLERIAPHIQANGGFVDKYIGDAVMAIFPSNSMGAIRAAIAIQRSASAYNTERGLGDDDPLSLAIGVGIFRGPTMLGTIGEPRRFEATVISDAVNVAARLEALTRKLGVRVLVGEAVLSDISRADVALRPLGRVVARGRGEPVAICEVLDAEDPVVRAQKIAAMADFLAATDAYERGAFEEALAAFDDVLAHSPNDGPSWVYQLACQRYIMGDDRTGFSGILALNDDKK